MSETRSAITLHESADTVPWPDTADGALARHYLEPMMREGTTRFIANANTRLHILALGDRVLPLTINDDEWSNSYVCSPYTHYVSYAREELRALKEPKLERPLDLALRGLGSWLRAGNINRTVHVNNWLLSTNLYPRLSGEELRRITALLVERFPRHALVFRSIHEIEGPEWRQDFESLGYRMLASRQIYYHRPGDLTFIDRQARKIWNKDRRLLERSGYEVLGPEQLTCGDLPRLLELYNLLYLDKYSYKNPQFTEPFLSQALNHGTLVLKALRKDGRIDGVLGFYARNGTMTTPLFGYDTSLPQELGLYRMLSVLTHESAAERGLLLHLSSGAAGFKRCRGARPKIEYSAIHDAHLPPVRRLAWASLRRVVNHLAVPLLEKHDL